MTLGLDKLTDRRKLKDVKLYEDIKDNHLDVDLKKYVKHNQTNTRRQVVQQQASFNAFYHSYFLRVNRQTTTNN